MRNIINSNQKKIIITIPVLFLSFFSYCQTYTQFFDPPNTYPINDWDNMRIHPADLNNDGYLDMVIDGGMIEPQSSAGIFTTNVNYFLNNGDGTYGLVQNYTKPSTHHIISDFADYNNDGNEDMLMYSFWQNGFYLYTGNGTSMSFNAPQFFSTSTHGHRTFFVDYDGDGDLDIVSYSNGSTVRLKIHLFENENNNFYLFQMLDTNNITLPTPTNNAHELGYMEYSKVMDVNGDGKLDFIAAKGAAIIMFIQENNGTFSQHWPIRNPAPVFGNLSYFHEFEDLDKDNYVDFVTFRDNKFNLFKGSDFLQFPSGYYPDDTTNYSDDSNFNSSNFSGRFRSADLDNDGHVDFIGNSRDQELRILMNPFGYGSGPSIHFDMPVNGININRYGVRAVDVNNDGTKDIVIIVRNGQNAGYMHVFIGKSSNLKINETPLFKRIVYPNPTKRLFNINMAGLTDVAIKVYSITGQIIHQEDNINTLIYQSELNGKSGCYFIEIISEGNIQRHKLIKQ